MTVDSYQFYKEISHLACCPHHYNNGNKPKFVWCYFEGIGLFTTQSEVFNCDETRSTAEHCKVPE